MPSSQDVNLHSLRRFFLPLAIRVDKLPYDTALVDDDVLNHVKNVLRLKPGDMIVAVLPDMKVAYLAVLKSLDKKQALLTLTEELPEVKDNLPPVTLGCALIKEQRWDVLIQKTTELGVTEIVPLNADRSIIEIKDAAQKQQRWRQVAKSGAEQSEGLFIPDVREPMSVEAFCKNVASFDLKLFPDERPGKHRVPLREALEKSPSPASIVAVIGPEGGWTDAERQCFLEHGFTGVSLGSRILRTETAAMTLMGVLRYAYDH